MVLLGFYRHAKRDRPGGLVVRLCRQVNRPNANAAANDGRRFCLTVSKVQ